MIFYSKQNDNIMISWGFIRLAAPAAMLAYLGAYSLKKTSWYRNIIILLGVEDHPYCTNCSNILWTTFYPFGIEVLFLLYFEHCALVRISKTMRESTIVYFIISGNASKEIPQKTYFFPILFFFIFWQAINNRTSSHNTVLHITIYT